MKLFNSAREYHNRTKYVYDDVKYVYKEFSSEPQPPTFKNYPGKPAVALKKDLPADGQTLAHSMEASSKFAAFRKLKAAPLTLDTVSQLLFLTNGVTLVRDFPAKKVYLRAAPSASSLQPIEIYLYAHDVEGLERGFYYFQPLQHQLLRIKDGDFRELISEAGYELDFLKNAPAVFFFTSVFSRNSWRYRNRAYRYCLMDAGYIGENFVLGAAGLDLAADLVGDFVDGEVNELLGIDGFDEAAILLAAVGADAGPIDEMEYRFGMHTPENDLINEHFKSLVRGIHNNSNHFRPREKAVNVDVKLPFKREPLARSGAGEMTGLPAPRKLDRQKTFQIIQKRRSSHNFLRSPLTLEEFSTLLDSLNGVPVLYDYRSFMTHLVVNDVAGLKNGIYRYHPQENRVELVREGTYRGDVSYLTLAQDAVFNCSVAFFFSADFEDINIFSNRGYRYAHFNIGMLSEIIYLASVAMGIGARGIGNFFDDSINTFFKVKEPHENILGGVIVGRI
ncbi:MAG: SagB/ThcOx family dehydrogenase [Calditrichia bacterium]